MKETAQWSVKSSSLRVRHGWVPVHTPPFSSCVSSGKWVQASEPWPLHLQGVDDNSSFLWLWWGLRGIRHKASCKNTCFLAFCETHGKPLRPSGLRGLYFKNHLNRKWGTFPASFVSLQAQDAWRLWFLAFTLATFFFQPVFISARHPFISRHQVQATLWRGQIYSFSLKTLTFTPHGL